MNEGKSLTTCKEHTLTKGQLGDLSWLPDGRNVGCGYLRVNAEMMSLIFAFLFWGRDQCRQTILKCRFEKLERLMNLRL